MRVVLASRFGQAYTRGIKEFDLDAKNLRGVINAMNELYPGLGEHLERETMVAIDGEIREIVYSQPLRPGCELMFIPRIEGG